jgi:hypothetical protein
MEQVVGVVVDGGGGADFTSDLEKDNATFKFDGSQVGKVGVGSAPNSFKVEGSDSSTRLDIQNGLTRRRPSKSRAATRARGWIFKMV